LAARESIAVGQRPLPMGSAELFHCGDERQVRGSPKNRYERRVRGDLAKSDM